MLPSNAWKSTEVGVGRNHRAAMLDRNRRVLGEYQNIYVGKQHPDSPVLWPNRASSSCALSARGRSRSTSGRARTPRTVTSRNGRGSAGSRRFSASSNVLAVKAFTLMPRAAAARRTCFASRSSSEIVVLKMQKPNRSSSTHQCRRAGRRLLMIPPWYVIHVSSSPSLWQYRANLPVNDRNRDRRDPAWRIMESKSSSA